MKIGAAKKSQEDGKIHPTLGGLIFFGDFNTITDELPNYFLDYRERLSGETRWSDRVSSGDGDWSGNIFDFYYKIIDRLTSDVKRPFKLDENLLRIDDTQAIAGGINDARNGKIFNMFALINVGERSGSGLCDVYHVWEESGFKRPEILETVDPERITLILQTDSDGNIDGNDGNPDGNDGNLTSKEALILQVLTAQPDLTAAKIAKKAGVSKPTVERTLRSLKEKGIIRREGSSRGKWIILK